MSSRSSKADKALQEKLQALLSHLLREEDNKYCADCDAKGPRWASWNLGIFVCIRCAGIHRNLGVHISRVKSVNLDAWTDEQVGSMQNMGNSKGRAVYEANLPDGFRRPQNDSALETFIRAKYEHKKYIAREWVPPTGPQKADLSVLGTTNNSGSNSSWSASERKVDLGSAASSVPRPSSMGSLKDNLVTSPTAAPSGGKPKQAESVPATSPSDDLFADFISAPLPAPAAPTATKASLSPDSEEKDFFNQVSSSGGAPVTNGSPGQGVGGAKIDKASILSLYAKSPPVQPALMQQQQQQQPGLNGGMVQLNGLTPQMVANNPFLMGGGIVAPQAPMGLPTGYGQPGQLAGVNPLSGFPGAAPATAAPFNNQAAFGGLMGFQAPLNAGAQVQPGLNGRMGSNLAGLPTGAAGNLNLINSQMAGLQLAGQPGLMNMSAAPTQLKTAPSNGNVLTSNFN